MQQLFSSNLRAATGMAASGGTAGFLLSLSVSVCGP
jgi:hypothetical protein